MESPFVADLITHLATALLPAAFFPRVRYVGVVALGAALPDLLARVPPLALEVVHYHLFAIPEVLFMPWGALHEPVPLALCCFLLSRLFVAEQRRAAGVWLGVGCLLHVALDVLQDHHGEGYFLLFPLSTERYELGLIGSEATIHIALPLAFATMVVWGGRWWLHKPSTKLPSEPSESVS